MNKLKYDYGNKEWDILYELVNVSKQLVLTLYDEHEIQGTKTHLDWFWTVFKIRHELQE